MEKLRFGSQGTAVADLQSLLNSLQPSKLPLLKVDGIFGPKTHARVREFQSQKGLIADGVVGTKTWEKLGPSTTVLPKPKTGVLCSTGHPSNENRIPLIQQSLAESSSSESLAPGSKPGWTPPKFSAGKLPSVQKLTGVQVAKAKIVYADSIDFSRVFVTDLAAPTHRAFVLAVPITPAIALLLGISPFFKHVQVLNFENFSPDSATLIHELAHVWQSQHHHQEKHFMPHCLLSQQEAYDRNLKAGFDHLDFPYSAYASVPGSKFGTYGGEQIAYQIEMNIAAAIAHVRSVSKNNVDTANVDGMSKTRVQDVRVPGVLR